MIKIFPPIYLNPLSKQNKTENRESKSDDTLKAEGKDEQTKNQAIKKEADRQTVSDLVKMSNRCIFSISTQFPWNFFLNTIDIEEDRVTFTDTVKH